MDKQDILSKIKALDGLDNDEKSYLINLVNTKKKYGLVWEDKPEQVEEELRTKLPVLREVKERAIINDKNEDGSLSEVEVPNHILIEGDNLHALTALSFTHENNIDLIYIDPPYNTGENDFRYHDAFKDEPEFIDKEHSFRHSTWLSFIEKRLQIAKGLLSDTGVFICHIDENEFDNLSILLREVFGEKNNLGTIVWNKKNPKGDSKGVANMHEYIFCYAKQKDRFLELENTLMRNKPNAEKIINKAKKLFSKNGKTEIPEEIKDVIKPFNFPKSIIKDFEVEYDLRLINNEFDNWLKRSDFNGGEKAYKFIDEKGSSFQTVSMAWPNKKKAPDDYFIPLLHPINKKQCPIPEKGWRNPPVTMDRLLGEDTPTQILDNMIVKGEITFTTSVKGENNQPRRKYMLTENLKENTPSIYESGSSDDSFFKNIDIDFPYAKPIEVAKYLLSSIHPNPKIILDFFAGTGSALHATMSNNTLHKKNVQCLLATNNEDGIADDCYRRNKSVIEGYTNKKGEDIEGLSNNNLRYYQCDFVDREPTQQNKRKITRLATELLCIKEDCYTEVKVESINPKEAQVFTNGKGKYMISIYHSRQQHEVQETLMAYIDSLENCTEKVKLYAFSPEKEALAEEFFEVIDKVEVVPLPEAIYNAYMATYTTLRIDKKEYPKATDNSETSTQEQQALEL